MREANRPRVVDERSEQAASLGQVPDRLHELGRHPDMDELLQPAICGDDAERAVLRVDERDGRLRDALQHHRKLELLDDRLGGAKQRP